jgi:hypothetical protein
MTKATHPRPRHSSVRHRCAVASRALAALLGGYALITAFIVAFARMLDLPGTDAINVAATPCFLLYLGAAMWAFYAATATRAWIGICAPAVVFALLAWLLASPAA